MPRSVTQLLSEISKDIDELRVVLKPWNPTLKFFCNKKLEELNASELLRFASSVSESEKQSKVGKGVEDES